MSLSAIRRPVRSVAILVVALGLSCAMEEGLEGARTAENRGQYDEALMVYARLLSRSVGSRTLPDRNDASKVSAAQFAEEVGQYLDWMRRAGGAVDSTVRASAEGIARCSTKVEQMTFPTEPVVRELKLDEFREQWHEAFYPEFVKLHEEQEPLLSKAFEDGFSFVRVSSRKSFSYEGLLVEERTWRATSFSLYYESSLVLPARPGRYLLLVQGKTQFASGSTWTTPWAAMGVEVPPQPSRVSLTLNTSTKKKR